MKRRDRKERRERIDVIKKRDTIVLQCHCTFTMAL